MDVYNSSTAHTDFKSKYKKSLCILKSLTGKTVPMNVINIDIVDSSETVAQYPLNTGTGTTAYDSVGSNHGTITNGEWQVHS